MNTALKERVAPLAIMLVAVLISIFIIGRADAETDSALLPDGEPAAAINFPIPELGNCASKSDCKSYCDKPSNVDACLAFAEKNDLMPKEELAMARKFMASGGKGPGGCTGKDSCESYCNDIANIDECVAFAETSGIMPPKELEEAKKVQAAIKRGVKPPACGGKKACDSYCEEPSHIEECISFASEAGFMSPEEQANAQKMIQAIKNGVKPLPCKGKEECDEYCGQEQNIEMCVAFAEAAGFMSKDDASMARKTRGKGPGNCKGKAECDAFCNNPNNEEICFNFGKDNGLIPPEELQKMEEGKKQFRDSLSNAPPEIAACLENAIGKENIDKLNSGAMRPSRGLGDKMAECFRQGEEQRIQNEYKNRNMGEGGQENSSEGSYERNGPGGLRRDNRDFMENRGPRGNDLYEDPRNRQEFGPRCEGGGCREEQNIGPRNRQAPRIEPRPLDGQGGFERPTTDNATGPEIRSGGGGSAPYIQGVEIAPPTNMAPRLEPTAPTQNETSSPAPIQFEVAPPPANVPGITTQPTSLVNPNSMMGAVFGVFRPLFLR